MNFLFRFFFLFFSFLTEFRLSTDERRKKRKKKENFEIEYKKPKLICGVFRQERKIIVVETPKKKSGFFCNRVSLFA